MIYICADTHGDYEIHKLSHDNWPEGKTLTKKDHVIIAGDFGLIFAPISKGPNRIIKEQYWLKWLEEKPWITVVVLGNHECHPRIYSEFPTVTYKGAQAYKVSESIYIIKHGEILTLEDKKFFCMGGAMSVDKQYRTEGVTWWPEEEPNYQDWDNAYKNLDKEKFKVDYVITHTCPASLIKDYFKIHHRICPVAKQLQNLDEKITYDEWHFGHMHVDEKIYKKYYCHYDFVERLL